LAAGFEPIYKFYQSIESNLREEWDGFLKAAEIERERKRKSGKPPLSDEESKQGTSAARFIIYNRTVLTVLCAEENSRTDDFDKVQECFVAKRDQMNKYLKLEEYVKTLGNYADEVRFPPFEFLIDPTGPRLYNFDALNDCILSGI